MPGSGHSFTVIPALTTPALGGKWSLEFYTCPNKSDSNFNFSSVTEFEGDSQLKNFFQLVRNIKEELVLIIVAYVNPNDFIVVGRNVVPERNLLDVVYRLPEDNMALGMTRHIFFLTIDCDVSTGESEIQPNTSIYDAHIMKGVTLYRIKWGEAELPIKKIKDAAEQSDSALSFYRDLNSRLSTDSDKKSLVSMVPSGKLPEQHTRSTENSGASSSANNVESTGNKEYALLFISKYHKDEKERFTPKEAKSDLKCVKTICSKMNDVELVYLNIKYKESLSESETGIEKSKLVDCMETVGKNLSQIHESQPIGKIWLFISGHGDENGIQLSASERIGLKELAKPFFKDLLKNTTKVLVINACRGTLPRANTDKSTQVVDNSCETKYGLMFRNKPGEDAWYVGDLPRCFAIYASVPGFIAFRPVPKNPDLKWRVHPSMLFNAMEIAAENLKTRIGLLDFFQKVQHCLNEAWNKCLKSHHECRILGNEKAEELSEEVKDLGENFSKITVSIPNILEYIPIEPSNETVGSRLVNRTSDIPKEAKEISETHQLHASGPASSGHQGEEVQPSGHAQKLTKGGVANNPAYS